MADPIPRLRFTALHLALFLAGSGLWMATLVMLVTATVTLAQGPDAGPDLAETLGPGLLGGITALQIFGLSALAGWLALQMTRSAGPLALPDPPRSVAEVMAWRPAPAVWGGAALVAGLTVWTFPSWFASWLIETTGTDDSSVEQITLSLSTQPFGETWPLIAAVVVVAPVCEELIFRGYLWRVFEASSGAVGAWVLTTLLFAAYHLDPIQAVALLPTAVLLGWLRLATGSIGPAIVAHAANNAAGVLVARQMDPTATTDLEASLLPALAGLVVTLIAALFPRVVARTRRPR